MCSTPRCWQCAGSLLLVSVLVACDGSPASKGTDPDPCADGETCDEAPQPGSPAFEALAVDLDATRPNVKSEEGRKFIMAGALGPCSSGAMCGLSLAKPLPLPRLQAWRDALLAANASAFEALQASARSAVRRLSSEDCAKTASSSSRPHSRSGSALVGSSSSSSQAARRQACGPSRFWIWAVSGNSSFPS